MTETATEYSLYIHSFQWYNTLPESKRVAVFYPTTHHKEGALKILADAVGYWPAHDMILLAGTDHPPILVKTASKATVETIALMLAQCYVFPVIISRNGDTFYSEPRAFSPFLKIDYQRFSFQMVRNLRAKAMGALHTEKKKHYPVELTTYYRFCLYKEAKEDTVTPISYLKQQEINEWCGSELNSVFLLRRVAGRSSSEFNTLEVTDARDATLVMMFLSEFVGEDDPKHAEWIWDKPSRLFGENRLSLARSVSTGQMLNDDGEPFRFAEGVVLGINPDEEVPKFETKGQLLVMAPNEAQRETFLKYCADYDVMVHATSDPIPTTAVDDVLFNAIVSVDPEKEEGFRAVWSTAFERFARDTEAYSLVTKHIALRATHKA